MASFPHPRVAGFLTSLFASILAIISIGLVGLSTPAQADSTVIVTVTSVASAEEPSQDSPTARRLSIKGSVAGLSGNQATQVQLKLSLSGPIRTRSAITQALADPASVSTQSTAATDTVQFTTEPGSNGTANWSVDFSTSDVMQATGNGVYAFGFKAVVPGTNSASANSGSSTLLFPWFPDGTSLDPTALSVVIPLTVRNSSTVGVHPATDSERSEITRLSQLVSVDSEVAAQVTWAIDPFIDEWLASIDDEQARVLTNKIAKLSGTRISLPYALADVDSLAQSDLAPEIADLVDVTDSDNYSIYFTDANKFDLSSFTRNGLSKNFIPVLSNVDFGVAANSTLTSNLVVNGNKVLTYDQAASDCLTSDKSNAVDMSQCVTSHVAMMTAEQPNRSRNVSVFAPSNWNCETATLNALIHSLTDQSWVAIKPLSTFITATDSKSATYSHTPVAKIIAAKNLRMTRALTTKADALAEVIDNPEFVRTYKQLATRTFSTQWSNQATAYQFAKSNLKNLQSLADSIAITTSPSITIGSASAQLPITVVNSSGFDVTVRVALTSNSPARFKPQTSDDISIKDGQKVTVTIPIQLYGAGRLSVSAALVSTHGKVVGSSQVIGITPTAYTRFASTIVIGALGLLVLLVAFRLIRRRMTDRKETS